MEDPLYFIDIVQTGDVVTARVKSQTWKRKFTSFSVEGVLETLMQELGDECF